MLELVKWLNKRKLVIIFVVLGMAVFLYNPLKRSLIPNNELSIWFDNEDPAIKKYYEFQELFGNDRVIIITYKEGKGALSSDGLSKLISLTHQLEDIKNVYSVVSLTNFNDFRKLKVEGKSIIVFEPWITTNNHQDLSNQLKAEIMNSSLVRNNLINEDASMVKLIVQMEAIQVVDGEIDRLISEIEQITQNTLNSSEFQLNGAVVTSYELNQLSKQDFIKFTGLCYGLIFVVVSLYYRRIYYLFIVLVSSFLSLWFTFGVYGAFGYQINIFTVMTPPIVISLSVIVTFHILNNFESQSGKSIERLNKALRSLILPCLYATLTTMVGFLSLLTSNMQVLQEFGSLNAFAALLSWIFPFLTSAILLPWAGHSDKHRIQIYVGQKLAIFLVHTLYHSKVYMTISIVLIVIFSFGITFVTIDMHPIGYFPKDHKVVKNHEFLTKEWGDYFPMTLMLVSDSTSNVYDRKTVNSMIAFNEKLTEIDVVTSTFSYIDYLNRYAHVLYGKELKEIIKNPFLLKTFTNGLQRLINDNNLNPMISKDNNKAKIIITGPLITTSELEKKLILIDSITESTMTSGKIEIAGYPSLFIKVIAYAFDSMKTSLALAAILIFIIILLFLRDIKIALISMIPNIFPILVLLGFLGFTGINLDLATCTIAAIILGIAIDDTIHMVYGYQFNRKIASTYIDSMLITQRHTGPVVLVTSVVLIVGFIVLLFSNLMTVYYFGLISIISIIAVLYGDIVILPILYKFVFFKKSDTNELGEKHNHLPFNHE